MKKYNSFIQAVTIDINPLLHDVLYIVEYSSGKTRYYFLCDISYELNQRINNFINTGVLWFVDSTIRTYKYGMQNIA